MKVFVHLNHGVDQSYLLTFSNGVTTKEIRGILDIDYKRAVHLLMVKASSRVVVSPKDRQKARMISDFVLTDGFTMERLA